MLSLIAAVGADWVIGRKNTIPWHSRADLQRFKRLTTGHAIIMGRHTYLSIGGILPNRLNIIVSRQLCLPDAPNYKIAATLDEAMAYVKAWNADNEIFIIGGEQLYEQALPLADKLYITWVAQETPDGDRKFPYFDAQHWQETDKETPAGEDPALTYVTYIRRKTEADNKA